MGYYARIFICKEAGAKTVDIQYKGDNIIIAADTEMLIELIVNVVKEEIDKLISKNWKNFIIFYYFI